MNFINHGLHERSDPSWEAVDNYARPYLQSKDIPLNAKLAKAAKLANDEGLPDICVSSYHGQFLSLQCKLLNAKNVLEIGTLGGYSAIHMASSFNDTNVVTFEIDPKHADVARRAADESGYGSRIEIVLGAAIDKLPAMKEEILSGKRPQFDLAFIDADKQNNVNYYNYAVEMCRKGGLVIVDNVVRKGRVADAALVTENPSIAGARAVIEFAGQDPRTFSTLIQTVGEKSYDGMLLSYINQS